jgi:Rrf2 family transcriptional regulator, cysteine metabolism repressor
MVALALNDRRVSLLREIARDEGISEKYLGQIVIPLRTSGLITSQRGAHGGYSLGRPAAEITVLEIVEAVEGPVAGEPESGPGAGNGRESPAVTSTGAAADVVWKKLHDVVSAELSSWTVQALADAARELGPPVENYVI